MDLIQNLRQRQGLDAQRRAFGEVFAPIEFSILLETRKIILHGSESDSSGCVVNGYIIVDRTELAKKLKKQVNWISVESLQLELVQNVTYSKPFIFNDSIISPCPGCKYKHHKIFSYTWLPSTPKMLYLDSETDSEIPFSFLVPGNTPATTTLGDNLDSGLHYELIAQVSYKLPNDYSTLPSVSDVIRITTKLPVTIVRSIQKTNDKFFVRRFDPTNIKAHVTLPNVIYAKSTIPVEVVLKGVMHKKGKWKVKRVSWKLNELATSHEDPCEEHEPLLTELKERINDSKNPWKRQSDTISTLEVKKVVVTSPSSSSSSSRSHTNTVYSPEDEIYGSRVADEDLLNVPLEQVYHPLDPDNPQNQPSNEIESPSTNSMAQPNLKIASCILFSDERVLVDGEIKTGWKSDYSVSEGGRIQLVTNLPLHKLHTSGLNSCIARSNSESTKQVSEIYRKESAKVNCSCDLSTNLDNNLSTFNVSHVLCIDIEVEEQSSSSGPVIRKMLRSRFPVILTERSNNFVPWEEECPPSYIQVGGLSPPEYTFD